MKDAEPLKEEGRSVHVLEARLHDHVDGVLEPEEERRVERHLRACVSCRREEEALRALTADLGALPREIRPARDLRPGIAERIAARSTPGPRQAIRTLRYPLAAAAVLLVIATAWLTTAIVGGSGTPGPAAEGPSADAPSRPLAAAASERGREPPPGVSPDAALVDARSLEAAYLPAIRALAELLERRRSELSPETVRTLEENLRVIDRAIEESRRALAVDPGDRILRELLAGGYEAKVEFLRRAAALTARG